MQLEQASAFTYATLVDRTGQGGTEFIFDGKRFVLPPGKTEITVPQFVAEWLFGVNQQRVHTTDGQFVCRFGLKDAADELVDRVGPEALDCSPITIDTTRAEGWDSMAADPDRASATVLRLSARPQDFRERQGTGDKSFVGPRKG